MNDKHSWSLNNWPEHWEHDDWPDDLRKLSQQALGHNVIFTFFNQFPELERIRYFMFDKGNVTCSFFGIPFVLIVRRLVELTSSGNQPIVVKAERLLEELLTFVQKNDELGEEKPEKYSTCVGLEFCESFHFAGNHREDILARLSPNLRESVLAIEKVMGTAKPDERIFQVYEPMLNLVDETIKYGQ